MDFFHALTKDAARKPGREPGAKPIIMVTGADGQLGNELRDLAAGYQQFQFNFTSHEDVPVENEEKLRNYFDEFSPDYCINCAAYTAVDKAEDPLERDKVFGINSNALRALGSICRQHQTKLIHISTDYVFNGKGKLPYKEDNHADPLNVYGSSKERGETFVREVNPSTIIIRSSWLYSSHGKNFVKTMLRLLKEKEEVKVVNDQIGSPTYAGDLAEVILQIISSGNWSQGTYHYSNTGAITWYQFAVAIKELSGSPVNIIPIQTSAFPTAAQRPDYSVFDTAKIRKVYGIKIPNWQDSLKKCLKKLPVNNA
jgi:dTDP-4-dehydrorhamnose reductase